MREQSSTDPKYFQIISDALSQHRQLMEAALSELDAYAGRIAEMAALLVATLRGGHKVLVAGNGGSAAEAQHFSAELVGRFRKDRTPYAALALTTDSSVLTAIANDYSYQDVFVRQIQALGQDGDLFIAFSTSGESENLVQAAVAAHQRGIAVLAFTGNRPNRLAEAADLAMPAPAGDTPIVQELHMAMTHLLCEIAETELDRGTGG